MAEKILVVEDEVKLAALLRDYLVQDGFEVSVLHRGDGGAVGEHARGRPGAARPDASRQERAGRVQDAARDVARGGDHHGHRPRRGDRPAARSGARRRRLHLQAVQPTRGRGRAKAVLRHRATIDGADLNLTVVEVQLLKVLADHPGRIYTREQLMDAMYRDERVVSDRTVDSHIKKIRRKISAVLPDREVVHSVYGLGYKYEW